MSWRAIRIGYRCLSNRHFRGIRFERLVKRRQVFRPRLQYPESGGVNWKYKKQLIDRGVFELSGEIDVEKIVRSNDSTLESNVVFEQGFGSEPSGNFESLGAPLFRLNMIRCSDDGIVLGFEFHHIAFDGETVGSIRSELEYSSFELEIPHDVVDILMNSCATNPNWQHSLYIRAHWPAIFNVKISLFVAQRQVEMSPVNICTEWEWLRAMSFAIYQFGMANWQKARSPKLLKHIGKVIQTNSRHIWQK